LLLLTLGGPAVAQADSSKPTQTKLDIRVIHATNDKAHVDSKIKDLVKEFSSLKFTAYTLLDEMTIPLAIGSSGRVQLPNGVWMRVVAKSFGPGGALRLEIDSEKPRFKTAVMVTPGATIAVGGPPFRNGALIFAITPARR